MKKCLVTTTAATPPTAITAIDPTMTTGMATGDLATRGEANPTEHSEPA